MLFFNSKINAQIFSTNPYYTGSATLYFGTGVFYGYLINGKAEGNGTYYFYDGSFFQGNYIQGFQNGPGVAISRFYGAVSGCWNGGVYIGPCQNGYNPYNTQQAVQNVVYNVQQAIVPAINQNPQTSTPLQTYNPTAYNVTQVTSDSNLGKKILSDVK
jgi:hypothetical protein